LGSDAVATVGRLLLLPDAQGKKIQRAHR
jgi:hypothetical protein